MASVVGMDEARRVLERLARIEELERGQAPASEVLGELRQLVGEAEAWARVERQPERVFGALDRCRAALKANDADEVLLLAH
jgi:hypothetical protein